MDSKFASFDGHKVHYWEGGSGFPVLMLHGVGPGTSIMGNYGPVLEPLKQNLHLFAMDLIGFGQSERKSSKPYFDVELWIEQGLAMISMFIFMAGAGTIFRANARQTMYEKRSLYLGRTEQSGRWTGVIDGLDVKQLHEASRAYGAGA